MAKNQPIHEMRLGLIRAAIWANGGGDRVRHNVTFERLYRDGDNWRSTQSFGRDDLLLLAKLADLTHTWIVETGQNRPDDEAEDEQV